MEGLEAQHPAAGEMLSLSGGWFLRRSFLMTDMAVHEGKQKKGEWCEMINVQ